MTNCAGREVLDHIQEVLKEEKDDIDDLEWAISDEGHNGEVTGS
jgi:hypothetical protein